LPVVNEGELLAILDAGAYGMVLASNYNSRPRPAEVLVDGKSVKVIRRRETMDDLLRPEISSR
jgi:diaminopimelate decarboxylase